MVKFYFYMISIFMYYLVCIYIYIIFFKTRGKRIKNKLEKFHGSVGVILEEELSRFVKGEALDSKNIKMLKKQIKNEVYKKYIYNFLLEKKKKDSEIIIEFVKVSEIFNPILHQKDADEYEVANKSTLIGEFKIDNQYEYLVNNCKNNSIYVQMNAFEALSSLGNVEYFIEGLTALLSEFTLINSRVIIEKIIAFKGNKNILNKNLETYLTGNDTKLNIIIITYFTLIEYKDCTVVIYNLMTSSFIDKEVKIACIKYFIREKSNKVKRELINMLKDEKWEIRALCASALGNYKDEDVIESLKMAISDSNWYVRQNSAKSLYRITNNLKELMNIVNGDDRYAADAIMAILSEENILEETLFEFNSEKIFA